MNNGTATACYVESTYITEPDYVAGATSITTFPVVTTVRPNKLIFLPASQIIVEKTTDGGTTWTSYGLSDGQKEGIFIGNASGTSVSIPLIDGVRNKLCGVRITITGMKYNVPEGTAETEKYNYWNSTYVASTERYCSLDKMYFWVNAISDRIRTTVYRATGANPNTWVRANKGSSEAYLSGGSGGNIIFLSSATFGGGTTQTGNYWNYRIECFTDGANGGDLSTSSNTSQQSVIRITGYVSIRSFLLYQTSSLWL